MFDEEKDENLNLDANVYDAEDFDVEVMTDEDELDGGVYDEDFYYDEDGTFYDKKGKKRGVIKKLGNIINPLTPFKAAGKFLAKKKKGKKAKKAQIANALMANQNKANINRIPLVTGGKSSTMQAVFGVGKAAKAIKMAVESKSVVVPLAGIEDINILTDNIMLQEQTYNQIVADIRIAVSGAAKKRTNKGFMPAPPGLLALQVLNSKFFGLRIRSSNTYTQKKYDSVRYILTGTGCDPIEFIVIPKEGSLIQLSLIHI